MDHGEWAPHPDTGFLGHVGPVLERWEGNQPILGFQAGEKHRNSRDVVQGGMLMTLADRTMGYTVRSALQYKSTATIQLDMHFLEPAHIGDFIEARANIVRVTTYLAFVESRLTVGDALIATGKGVWKFLRPPPRAD